MPTNGVQAPAGEQPVYGGMHLDAVPEPVEQRQPPIRPLLRRLSHWGPLLALAVIAEISISCMLCHLQYLPPSVGLFNAASFLIFLLWVFLTISNLFAAAHNGPGYVPLGWDPESIGDRKKLQFCVVCEGYKVPRSHHCRKCNRCVMKMDHHCPWINNCVGHNNQPLFIKFLLSAVVGCSHALFILGPSIYYAVFKKYYVFYGLKPVVDLGLYGLLAAIFGFGLAVGVVLAVGFLFIVQMLSVSRNRTGIEDYIVKKAKAIRRRRKESYLYPYDLGWKQNLKEVFTWEGPARGDGIQWPVVEGSDQFSFTLEQKYQKRKKIDNAVEYIVVRNYSGSICTCWHGVKTFCCQPYTDEPRIPLYSGHHLLVTRWAKYWLYGEQIGGESRVRGWFPRNCVRSLEILVDDDDDEEEEEEEEGSPPPSDQQHPHQE